MMRESVFAEPSFGFICLLSLSFHLCLTFPSCFGPLCWILVELLLISFVLNFYVLAILRYLHHDFTVPRGLQFLFPSRLYRWLKRKILILTHLGQCLELYKQGPTKTHRGRESHPFFLLLTPLLMAFSHFYTLLPPPGPFLFYLPPSLTFLATASYCTSPSSWPHPTMSLLLFSLSSFLSFSSLLCLQAHSLAYSQHCCFCPPGSSTLLATSAPSLLLFASWQTQQQCLWDILAGFYWLLRNP